MTEEMRGPGQQERGLRRELRYWEAITMDSAIMAPGAAMALNDTATAGLVGRGAPGVRARHREHPFRLLRVYPAHLVLQPRRVGLRSLRSYAGRRVPTWEAVFPVIGLAILIYVIYKNVYPLPDFPFNIFPYIAAAWFLVGLGSVLLVPGLARRIGANLAAREGMAVEGERGTP